MYSKLNKLFFPTFALLAIFLLVAQTSFSQNFRTEQTTLIIKKTADWCPYCGSYGWDYFGGLYSSVANNPDAIPIAMHYSGDLQNPASLQITNNYNAPGQPVIIVNNEDILLNTYNVAQKISDTKNKINNNSQRTAPIALDVALYNTGGSSYTLKVDAQATQDLGSIDVYAGVYLIKNNLVHPQAGRTNTEKHINVLDKSLTAGSIWGPSIFTGNIVKGKTAELDFVIPSFSTSADVRIAVLLWNKLSNGSYRYLNGQMILSNTITTTPTEAFKFDTSLSIVTSNRTIEVNWEGKTIDHVSFLNALGQNIQLVKTVDEANKLVFERPNVAPGVYIVSVISGDKKSSRSIYLTE